MELQPIVVELELHQADGCLSGRITGPDGDTAGFEGWLGLTAALDALLRGADEPDRRSGDDPKRTHEGGTP